MVYFEQYAGFYLQNFLPRALFTRKPCEPQLENDFTLMLQFSPRLRDELIIILRLAEMA
jgi:hypothetical protein